MKYACLSTCGLNLNTFVFGELSALPDLRQTIVNLGDAGGRQIGQQLGQIQFRIDLMAAANDPPLRLGARQLYRVSTMSPWRPTQL